MTDEVLERLVNEGVRQGWELCDIRFVVKESSHRPVMAFLFFVRHGAGGLPEEGGAGHAPEG